jgi:phosphoglycolate phosphatase-like HAD superfamily hydrolase
MPARAPDLASAFDRIDAFLAVQGAGPAPDAVLALEAAVGVDAASLAVVGDRLAALADAGQGAAAGSVLFGILVGLFAAEGTA